jgi:hypothetical protein
MRVLNCENHTIQKLIIPQIPQYSNVSYAITFLEAKIVLVTGGQYGTNLADVH